MRFPVNARIFVIASAAKQSRDTRRKSMTLTRAAVRAPHVYIMASRRNGTLYVGVTSDLARRVYEHREGLLPGFTRQYGCKLLVWYESYGLMTEAIDREKQIKAGSRTRKIALIEAMNADWIDLYPSLA
jgi:putative endonuclease